MPPDESKLPGSALRRISDANTADGSALSAIARQECVRFARPRTPRGIDRQLYATVPCPGFERGLDHPSSGLDVVGALE
jgi:hypothetical protein